MKSVFVDAYYFIALLNPRDAGHSEATGVVTISWQKLVTTEWVLIEAGNALSAPVLREKFVELVDSLRARQNVEVVYSSAEWFDRGLALYRHRPDKHWSLTDCLSFCVMQELGISEALTADVHFQQAGLTALLRGE